MPRGRAAAVSGVVFGTDGWRGVMAREVTFRGFGELARAASSWLRCRRGKGRVLVGYDRRFLSPGFASFSASVFAGGGHRVSLCREPVPTSAASLFTARGFDLAFVVTASHNPPEYNGAKIKWEGGSAPPVVMEGIGSRLGGPARRVAGGLVEEFDPFPDYLEYLRSRFPRRRRTRGTAPVFVADCMHGCAGGLLPFMREFRGTRLLRAAHDPLFGGTAPEPIERNLGALAADVRRCGALAGFAFDGDADRFALLDERGRYVSPALLFGLMTDLLIKRGLRGRLVQSVSMGRVSRAAAEAAGLEVKEVPVGFKWLGAELRAGGALAAAEESGGYTWAGNLPERDGVLCALFFMEALESSGRPLSVMIRDLQRDHGPSAYLRSDLPLRAAPKGGAGPFMERLEAAFRPPRALGTPVSVSRMDGLKLGFADGGWLLVRLSGTEPLLRLYAETADRRLTEDLLRRAAAAAGGAP
jgi:phosphomannomutase